MCRGWVSAVRWVRACQRVSVGGADAWITMGGRGFACFSPYALGNSMLLRFSSSPSPIHASILQLIRLPTSLQQPAHQLAAAPDMQPAPEPPAACSSSSGCSPSPCSRPRAFSSSCATVLLDQFASHRAQVVHRSWLAARQPAQRLRKLLWLVGTPIEIPETKYEPHRESQLSGRSVCGARVRASSGCEKDVNLFFIPVLRIASFWPIDGRGPIPDFEWL